MDIKNHFLIMKRFTLEEAAHEMMLFPFLEILKIKQLDKAMSSCIEPVH